ncbi:hypothetical protein ACFQUU_12570 [Herbaspirillum sp. GCM10030257]|uniref:hypothetical protein n=1 Tax=Herbaspirillum sp. GCM10030257 TaxID=3273393 RepID=UPI00361A1BA9
MDSVLAGLLLFTSLGLLAVLVLVVRCVVEEKYRDAIYTVPTLEDLELIMLRIRLEEEN